MDQDSFWDHWGKALQGMSTASTTTVQSLWLQPREGELPTVVSRPFELPTPSIQKIDFPAVASHRIRLPILRGKVSTVQFSSVEPTLLESRQAQERSDKRSGGSGSPPKRSLPKIAPPPGVPMRERLLSVLQPPISTLLGDNRLYLPMEPFPYQYEGINFLTSRWSAMLADEMGLGKTMQTIISLRLLLRAGMARTCLLICPKPLVTNWLREFSIWAEEIPVANIRGDTWSRRNFWLHDRSPVKIANYESLTRDESILKEGQISFDLVVLDEAQRIKNRESKTAAVVHGIKRRRSWALTGTPVENQPGDLVSLLAFVHNTKVEDHGEERTDLLRDAVSEVLLRRTKEMVMKDMPPKLIRDRYLDLGPAQRDSYDAAEKEGLFRLNDLGEEITIEHVFELVRVLKQICNFDPVTGESAKAEQLRSDMEEIAASGQKAILFSQWVVTLEHLANELAAFRPLLYHGKIPHGQRDGILKEFKESKNAPILLLSYGTGAVGLNLQFTNYVFLFDRWWNPAIEDQAINRAHRIGQKSPVSVSRFITPGTIEERIAEVLEKKRELFAFLIDDHDPLSGGGLSRDDIFGLFDLKFKK